MKFEALLLHMLCAGSMLVCSLVFGDMLLARPATASVACSAAGSTRCPALANLPGQTVVVERERS